MMHKYGYIRTSTDTQITDRQVIQLEEICDQVFIEDGVSAVSKKRPVYDEVMTALKPGDIFIVCSLDRAFHSSLDALSELEKLHQRGVQFQSLSQNFDTTTPDGKFLYTPAAGRYAWQTQKTQPRTNRRSSAHP
ncbi:MAG: recombinase family protein [Candidatus Thiodiazotropha sp. (ex Lucinoma kastoroae)]|nr:recombinase family protein [Candidatus Thiodiazotropha sp. (ex Lucinoma kastoroae)]